MTPEMGHIDDDAPEGSRVVAPGEPVEGNGDHEGEGGGCPGGFAEAIQPRDARCGDFAGHEAASEGDQGRVDVPTCDRCAGGPECTGQYGCDCEAEAGGPPAGACHGTAPLEPAPPVARPLISAALRSEILEYVQAFAIAIVLAAFIITFIAQSFVVEGSSMEPSLHNRERLLVNKLVYRFEEPHRGDVVVFRYPANPKRKFIKRIIGVPGDIVEVRDGHVILNGQILDEDYTMDLTFGSFGPEVVPPGRYFVLGDNRNNSDDSRYPDVGFVPRSNIVGKAFVTWWPPGEIGLVRTPSIGAGTVGQ